MRSARSARGAPPARGERPHAALTTPSQLEKGSHGRANLDAGDVILEVDVVLDIALALADECTMSAREPLVRLLSAAESERYSDFFAAGAQAHPDTLRIAPEDIECAPFSTAATDDSATFVAEAGDGSWLGVCTVERERGRLKRRHVAWLVRMYVTAHVAGRGVGRALLARAMARAAAMPGIAKVNLTVAAHNAAAIHLYESVGFRTFSREEDAFRDPESRTELSMSAVVREG